MELNSVAIVLLEESNLILQRSFVGSERGAGVKPLHGGIVPTLPCRRWIQLHYSSKRGIPN